MGACRGQRRIDHNGRGGWPNAAPGGAAVSVALPCLPYIYIYMFHSYIYIYMYIYIYIVIYIYSYQDVPSLVAIRYSYVVGQMMSWKLAVNETFFGPRCSLDAVLW